ncbi:hypothetical protein [Zhaonella formicivorans]|uniref:hypothetical protein n=1 Tax=Zhaonella formicivorans TaxID=2528593 RepID=UPI0010DC00AD|nr:hypothetical protein [Zhaonella formicivorans]
MRTLRISIIVALLMVLLFPAAASAQALTSDIHHLMLRLNSDGTLTVREQVVVTNSSENAVQEKFSIALPEGFTDLQLIEGIDQEKTKLEDGLLIVEQPIPPGQATYKLEYKLLPGAAPHFLINKKFTMPTKAFYVMTQKGTLEVISDKLKDAGPLTMGDQELQLYEGTGFTADTVVNVAVQPVTAGTSAESAGPVTKEAPKFHNPGHIRLWYQSPFSGINAHLFLAIVIALPILGLGYHFYRKRAGEAPKKSAAQAEEEAFRRLLIKEKTLKAKLVELEQNYADQKVDEEEYQAVREIMKKQLLAVRAQLKSFTD